MPATHSCADCETVRIRQVDTLLDSADSSLASLKSNVDNSEVDKHIRRLTLFGYVY